MQNESLKVYCCALVSSPLLCLTSSAGVFFLSALVELEPIDEQLNNKLVYKISLITFSSFFISSGGDEFQMKSIAIENVIT